MCRHDFLRERKGRAESVAEQRPSSRVDDECGCDGRMYIDFVSCDIRQNHNGGELYKEKRTAMTTTNTRTDAVAAVITVVAVVTTDCKLIKDENKEYDPCAHLVIVRV